TPAPTGHLLAIARRANHLWAEENEIVREGCDQRHPIRVRAADKTEEQKGGRDPGQPFHFYRQNKKDVDHFVRIEMSEGKKERGDQHRVRELRVEEKGGDSDPDHPE